LLLSVFLLMSLYYCMRLSCQSIRPPRTV